MGASMSDDLAYTIAGIGRKRDPYAERRTFAQRLIAQGTDTSPVQSPWQGAARLAQALMGGYESYATDRDEKKATEDRNSRLASAIAKMKTDPEGGLAEAASLDPEYGLRAASSLAIEKVKQGQQRDTRQAAANSFGASYGMPSGIQSAPLPAPGGTGNAAGAIAGIESGGRYDAVGPVANSKGNRAYGKYQVLDSNIPTWTQEVLGQSMTPEQFLASPQAQEAVFQAKFGQYVQKYGSPEAASRAWFAGEGGMNSPGAVDVNGMTVDRYGQKFAQAYGPGATGPTPPPAPPVNVRATPPGQPQPLTINMGGPGGVPQGAAENVGMPPAPSPQGVQGPTMMAQAPSVPDVPRPQPTPQQIRRAQQQIMNGVPQAQVESALNAEIDRDWAVQRERAKMQFEQQSQAYTEGRKPTEAQKAVDSNFGKDYAEWVAGGGHADTQRQIVQLEEVLGKLKSGKNLTGAFVGNTPDFLLNMFNPEAISARNAVEEVVQRNLRLVLGAQFTEKEGERLIARAYNPSLSEEENAKRVGRLLEQIKAGAAAKVSAGQYYEQHGTLRGWTGKLPTLADFDPDARTDRGSPTDLRKKYGLE